jgi:hypothetical protein
VAGIVNTVLAEGGTTTTTTTKKVEEDFDGLLNACKDYAKCSPASDKCQLHEAECGRCFAHALVRLYDASLDWMLVAGERWMDDFDINVLAVPVFSALFAEIGKSSERGKSAKERDAIEARVEELKSKQDGIIDEYRKQAERIRGKYTEDVDDEMKEKILNEVMSEAKLLPAPFRFRNCSSDCDECRADIDRAVDWLEGDKGRTPAREVNERHNYITQLTEGVAGHYAHLRGTEPTKRRHLNRCEPCFLHLLGKTRGTQWASRKLVGRDGSRYKPADMSKLDVKVGQMLMDWQRRVAAHEKRRRTQGSA